MARASTRGARARRNRPGRIAGGARLVLGAGFVAALVCAAPVTARAADPAADRHARREAIARFEAFLEKYPATATRAEVLFTLADLHADEEIDAAMSAAPGDGAVLESVSHAASIRYLAEVVERYPAFARREEALYRLGYLRADARDDAAAAAAFESLVQEFPSGVFAASGRVRLAEIALRRGEFAAAAAAFRDALARGADARAEEIHYRLAWSLYKSSDFAASRETLVEGIGVEASGGADPELGLLREMIHLLAVIAVGSRGGGEADAIAARVDPAARRVFLAEVGEILLDEDRAAESIRFFDAARGDAAAHERAPELAQAAIDASVAAESRERAAERMIDFAAAFGPDGEWRRTVALSAERRARVDALCEENIYRGGVLLYEAARDSAGDPELARRAETALSAAVAAYPGAPGVDDARFLLGELARAAERWGEAASLFAEARVERVSAARREPLLFGRVLALEGARQEAAARAGQPGGGERAADGAAEIATREIAAIDAYLAAHPEASEAERLVEKRADLLAMTGAHAQAAGAYAAILEREAPGSARARELEAKRGAALVGAGRPSEAAAAFEAAAAPELAAAALYEAAQRDAESSGAAEAGLALFALCARHPGAEVAFASALDGVDFLATAARYDTLAACAAALPAPVFAGAGQADSLRHVLAAAAARAEARGAPAAPALFEVASRFGQGLEVAALLVRAADLEAARGAGTDVVLALLERARPVAARGAAADSIARDALSAGIARRLGDTFARAGREREAISAYDAAIAFGKRGTAREPALDREIALAAIEKADRLRAAFESRPADAALTAKEAKRLRSDAAPICDLYAMAAERAFRDLTPRACIGAAEIMVDVASEIFADGLAKEDAALIEEARHAAASASSYRAAAAALELEPGSEWSARLDGLRWWRDAFADGAIARADSVTSALSAGAGGEASADPKRLARAIVRLSDLSRVLGAVGPLGDAADAREGASAALALRRGALHETMIMLLLAAPLPADLDDEARAAYATAVEERVASWRTDALEVYRAEIARATARAAAPEAADAADASGAPWMLELTRRAGRLENAVEINPSLTRRP